MKMINFIMVIVVTGIICLWLGSLIGHRLGFKDGWMSCVVDAAALDNYHSRMDEEKDDGNPAVQAEVWSQCITMADKMERQWNELSLTRKWDYPVNPFWKKGAGEPRRISKAQQAAFLDALKRETTRAEESTRNTQTK